MKILYKLTKRCFLFLAFAIPLPSAGFAAQEMHPAPQAASLAAEQNPVEGVVLDESGKPLVGATVVGEEAAAP